MNKKALLKDFYEAYGRPVVIDLDDKTVDELTADICISKWAVLSEDDVPLYLIAYKIGIYCEAHSAFEEYEDAFYDEAVSCLLDELVVNHIFGFENKNFEEERYKCVLSSRKEDLETLYNERTLYDGSYLFTVGERGTLSFSIVPEVLEMHNRKAVIMAIPNGPYEFFLKQQYPFYFIELDMIDRTFKVIKENTPEFYHYESVFLVYHDEPVSPYFPEETLKYINEFKDSLKRIEDLGIKYGWGTAKGPSEKGRYFLLKEVML